DPAGGEKRSGSSGTAASGHGPGTPEPAPPEPGGGPSRHEAGDEPSDDRVDERREARVERDVQLRPLDREDVAEGANQPGTGVVDIADDRVSGVRVEET